MLLSDSENTQLSESQSTDLLGESLFKLLKATDEETYLEIIRQNSTLLTERADRRLVAAILHYENETTQEASDIVKRLKRHRCILLRCRRLGIDQAFRPDSILDTLIEFAIGKPEQMDLINGATDGTRHELDNIFSLRELEELSLQEPAVKSLIAELGMDNLRNMIIVSALMEFSNVVDIAQFARVIRENPELLSDDALVLLETIVSSGEHPQLVEHFKQIMEALIRCREMGLDAWIQEQSDTRDMRSISLPEELSRQIREDESNTTIVQKMLTYGEKYPSWLQDLEDSNTFIAGIFAFTKLLDSHDDGVQWMRQIALAIDQYPIMLTKRFDDVILEMSMMSDQMYLPDGIPEDYGQIFKDRMLFLLNVLRGLRGIGFGRRHIKRYIDLMSSKGFPADLLAHINESDPLDHAILTGIGLLQSQLPVLVCLIMDGRIQLAEAVSTFTSAEMLGVFDDYHSEKLHNHIAYMMASTSGDLQPIYLQAELNYAFAVMGHNQKLKAYTASDLRDCTLAIRTQEPLPEKRFALQERGLSAARAAVAHWTAADDTNESTIALFALGSACLDNAYGDQVLNHKEAIACFSQVLEIGQEFLTAHQKAILASNLGIAYCGLVELTDDDAPQNADCAIHYYQMALQHADRELDVEVYVNALNGLGNAYAVFGEARTEYLQRSINCYQEVLEISTEPRFAQARVHALLNLSASLIALSTGNHQSNLRIAQSYLEQAINVCDSADYPTAKEDRGKAFANLAGVFFDLKKGGQISDIRRAAFYGRSALKAFGADPTTRNGAQIRSNLGAILTELARLEQEPKYLVEASNYLHEALKAPIQLTGVDARIKTLNNLSGVYRTQALMHYSELQDNLRNSIHFLNEALSCINPDVHVSELATTARNLGDLYFEWADYLPDAWDEASRAYLSAIDAKEKLYRTEGLLEARQSELKEIASLTRKGAYCLARSGQLEKAAEILELGRTRALATNLLLDSAVLDKALPEDRASFKSARDEVLQTEKRERRRFERSQDADTHRDIELSSELRAARTQLDSAVARIRRYLPEFMPEIRNFQDIASSVSVGEILVYLAATEHGGIAIVITPQSVSSSSITAVWLDSLTTRMVESLLGIDKLLSGNIEYSFVRAQVADTPPEYGELPMCRALDEILPRFGQYLRPLVQYLTDTSRKKCFVVAAGLLSLLPLHAAKLEESYFVDKGLEITFIPSAFALKSAQNALATVHLPTLFAVSDPSHAGGPSLDYAKLETGAIASLFSGDNVFMLEQEDASQEAVYKNISGATYVHFSCHGRFNLNAPLFSALLLTGTDELTLSDVLDHLRLSGTRMVVLSACQTAIPDFSNAPDEMIGLPVGFMQAGVPGVLGSLWSVNDLSTALLVLKFYEYHLQGDATNDERPMSPARALRKAQIWLRDVTNAELSELFTRYKLTATDRPVSTRLAYEMASEKFREHTLRDPHERPYAHPYYWAPFVFYGV